MCFIRAYKWWCNSKKDKITKIHNFDPLLSKLSLPKGHIFWKRITYSEKQNQSCIATVMLAEAQKKPCWWCRKGPGWLKTSPAQMGAVSSTSLRTCREVQQLQTHWKCHHRLLSTQVRCQLPLAPWARACQEKHFRVKSYKFVDGFPDFSLLNKEHGAALEVTVYYTEWLHHLCQLTPMQREKDLPSHSKSDIAKFPPAAD